MGVACGVYGAGWDTLQLFVSLEAGDCSRLRSWHDVWCGSHSLKELYLDLYACLLDLDASICSVLGCPMGGKGGSEM